MPSLRPLFSAFLVSETSSLRWGSRSLPATGRDSGHWPSTVSTPVPPRLRLRSGILLLLGALALTSAPRLSAQPVIWVNRGTDDHWSTGDNWLAGTPPSLSGTDVVHFAVGVNGSTSFIDQSGWMVDGLIFDPTLGLNTLYGNSLTIGASGITDDSAFTQIINSSIYVGPAAQVWTTTRAGGALVFGNQVVLGAQDGAMLILIPTANTTMTFNGIISGGATTSSLIISGDGLSSGGTVIFNRANTYDGLTSIGVGATLLANNHFGSATGTGNVYVTPGGTLGGTGFVGSPGSTTTVVGDGILAPGTPSTPGTLTFNSNLTIAGSASNPALLNFRLGQLGGANNDLVSVNGNLSISDALINITALAGFDSGVYPLFAYSGSLSSNSLSFGSTPLGFTYNLSAIPGTHIIDLLVNAGALQYWHPIVGPGGNWDSAVSNFTDASGQNPASWGGVANTAVFAGNFFGVASVYLNAPVSYAGLQFKTNGYTIYRYSSYDLTPDGVVPIRTDSGVTATIAAPVDGSGGIRKTGPGTLVMTADNTYTGGTVITDGMLEINRDSNLGAVPSTPTPGALALSGTGVLGLGFDPPPQGLPSGPTDITINANRGITLDGANTNLLIRAGVFNVGYDGVIADAPGGTPGRLNVVGQGLYGSGNSRLSLGVGSSSANTYSGGTTVTNAELHIVRDDNLGAVPASFTADNIVLSNGNLLLNNSMPVEIDSKRGIQINGGNSTLGAYYYGLDSSGSYGLHPQTLTYNGVISNQPGSDGFLAISGNVVLGGDNTYTQGTLIGAGSTLQLGTGGTSGSIKGIVFDSGTLIFNRSDRYLFGYQITAGGKVEQRGPGELVLTAANDYTGGTSVDQSVLTVSSTGSLGTGPVTLRSDFLQQHPGVLNLYNNLGTQTIGTLTGNRGTSINLASLVKLSVNETENSVYAGTINGANSWLFKSGAGTLTLTGDNTYGNGTTVTGGLIEFSNPSNLGFDNFGHGGVITLNGGGLRWATGNTTDLSPDLSFGANGGIIDTNGNNVTFASNLNFNGSGMLTKAGLGNLTLRYLYGNFRVTAGLLVDDNGPHGASPMTLPGGTMRLMSALRAPGGGIASNPDALSSLGTITLDGGGIRWAPGNTDDLSAHLTLGPSGGVVDTNGNDVAFASAFTGNGGLTKVGAGSLTLNGALSYTGGTTIAGGTVTVNTSLAGTGPVTLAGGALAFGAGSTQTLDELSGSSGTITTDGSLIVNQATTTSYGGGLAGAGTLTKDGLGTLALTGNNTYTGGTTVSAGPLLANNPTGSATGSGAVTVQSGATLGGGGFIGGATSIANGGILSPGNLAAGLSTPGTLTFNADLILHSGSILNYNLGTPNVVGGATNDLVQVNGNLTLSGLLSVIGAADFGAGAYRLINYTGTLTNQTLALGSTLPAGFSYTVQTSVANQVNLVVSLGGNLVQFWDGALTTGDGTIPGGEGIWDNTVTNFTDSTGKINGAWKEGTAVFGSKAGPVTLGAPVSFAGLQFTIDGYTITGSATNSLVPAAAATIRTDPGVTATISAPLTGSGSVTKTDAGTLTLTGASTYTGGTAVNAGTLTVDPTGSLAATGAVTLNGGTLNFNNPSGQTIGTLTGAAGTILNLASGVALTVNQSALSTFAGTLAGPGGSLVKDGTGNLILAGANTYTGGTTVSAGELQVGNGGTSGSIIGNVSMINGSQLAFNRSDNLDFDGSISGVGTLTKSGNGTLTLTGDNSFLGYGYVYSGSLQLGNGGTTGSVLADVALFSGAHLTFNRADTLTYAGLITGSGTLTKIGAGTLTLTGANTYTGGTTVNGGTLQLGNGGGTGSITRDVALSNSSVLAFNRSDSLTYSGAVSGNGSLQQNGAGTLILTGNNDYSGGTSVTGGILQIGNGGNSGSLTGAVSLASNTGLAFSRTDNLTYGGIVSGDGSLSKYGDGILTLTGANTYTGLTRIYRGTLQLGDVTATGSIAGNITVDPYATLAFRPFSDLLYSGTINGNGALSKIGYGWLTLSGDNTYTGGTTVSDGGGLVLGNGGTTGSIMGNVSLAAGTNLRFFRSNSVTYGDVITGSGSVIQSGTGTLILTGNNTYTGGTTVNGGTLNVGSADGNMAGGLSGTSQVTLAGGTLNLNAQGTLNPSAVLDMSAGTVNLNKSIQSIAALSGTGGTINLAAGSYLQIDQTAADTFAGRINDATPGAAGNLIYWGSSGQPLTLTGSNGYTGTTFIQGGTLNIGSADGATAGSLAGTTAIQLQSGTLNLNALGTINPAAFLNLQAGTLNLAANQTFAGLAGEAGATLQLGAGTTLTDFASGASDSYHGILTGAGSLAKTGSGTLFLTGSNDYTGTTTISGGVLSISSNTALRSAAGGTMVASGAALQLQGNANLGNEALTLSGTGIASDGALRNISGANAVGGPVTLATDTRINSEAGLLTLSGNFSGAGKNLTVGGGGDTTVSGVIGTGGGSLTKDGNGLLQLNAANTYTGGTTVNAGTLSVGTAGSLASTGAVALNGGTLNFSNPAGQVLDGLSGVAGTFLNIGAGPLTVSQNGASSFAGTISGNGLFTVTGANTYLNLTGDNTYSRGTSVSNSATLEVSRDSNLGATPASATPGFLSLNNGKLVVSSSFELDSRRGISLSGGGNTLNLLAGATLTYNGAITDAASGTPGGLAFIGGTVNLGGANTYTGQTYIGESIVNVTGSLASTGSVGLYGGTLNLAQAQTLGGLTGDSTALIHLADGAYLTVNQGGESTYDGILEGHASLILTGGGILNLSGANTYTGGTYITYGLIGFTSTDNFGSGNITLDGGGLRWNSDGVDPSARLNPIGSGGGTFDTNGYTTTLATSLSGVAGDGGLTKVGDGELILQGANTYAGQTTVKAGALTIEGSLNPTVYVEVDGGTLNFNHTQTIGGLGGNYDPTVNLRGTIHLAAQATLTDNQAADTTYAGDVTGAGSFLKTGSGTLILTGTGSHTGGTTVEGGILQLGDGHDSGALTGQVAVGGGATLAFNRSDDITYDGTISDQAGHPGGALLQQGAGLLTLTGANTYTGRTLVYNTTLAVATLADGGTASSIGAATADAANLVLDNSTLRYTGSGASTDRLFTLNAAVTIRSDGSGDLVFANPGPLSFLAPANGSLTGLTLDGTSNGTLAAQISDNGTDPTGLTMSGSGTWSLTGSSNYTGGTLVNSGTLQLGNGGTTGSIAGDVTVAKGATLAFNRSDNTTFGGSIMDDSNNPGGGVRKLGLNTLTLTGDSNFTGGTVVEAGTLQLGNGGTTGSITGNVAVSGRASLAFNRSDVLTFAKQISDGATPGGSVAVVGNGKVILTGDNSYTGGTTIRNGVLEVTALADGGFSSSLGASSNGASNLILNDGTLRYAGSDSVSTDRLFLVQGSGLLDASGDGSLNFTNSDSVLFGSTLTGDVLGLIGDGHGTLAAHLGDPAIGLTSVIKLGSGSWSLTGANTYTGATSIYDGTLEVATVANGNAPSSLGQSSASADHLILQGGTLRYSGPGTMATDRLFTVVGSGTLDASGAGLLNFTNTGAAVIEASGPSARLNLTGEGVGRLAAQLGDAPFAQTSVEKSGIGTWTLAGTSTYTGGTFINNGLIEFSAAANLGAGRITLNGGGLRWAAGSTTDISARLNPLGDNGGLFDTNGNNVTFASTLTGTGTLTKAGAGNLTLSTLYDGDITVTGGYLVDDNGSHGGSGLLFRAAGLAGGSGLSAPGTITLDGGGIRWALGTTTDLSARLNVGAGGGVIDTNGNNVAFASTLTGTGSLTKVGDGALTLNGALDYTGGTVIAGGTVTVNTSLAGTGPVTLAGGALAFGAGSTQTLDELSGSSGTITTDGSLIVNQATTTSYGGGLAGAGTLTKDGLGTLALTGNNTYTGGTTLAGGILSLGSSGALGSTGAIAFTGGTLQFTAANTTDYSNRFSTAADQAYRIDTNGQNVLFATALTSAGGTLAKLGAGTLTLTGANAYDGGTTLAGGTLSLGSTGALGTTGPIAFSGGALQYTAANTTDYSNRFSTAAGQAYRIDTNGQTVAFANPLTSSGGSLTKLGDGTLALAADNTSLGSVAVNRGTLATGGNNTAFSGLTVGSGATFSQTSGASSVSGTLAVAGGGTLQLGAGTFTAGGPVNLEGAYNQTGGIFATSGAVNLGVQAGTATYTLANGTLTLGGSLLNEGTLALANGSITGGGTLANHGLLSGSGTLSLSGGFTNPGVINQSGGTLEFGGNGGTYVSSGTLNLGTPGQLRLTDITLSNTGTVNLNGRTLTGTGTLSNQGIVAGPGTVSASFSNTATGVLAVGAGTTGITQDWTNAGSVQLGGNTALLTGGVVTNTGTVQGLGVIGGSGVVNHGTIEPVGGILNLTAPLTNASDGTLRVSTGNKLVVGGAGLAANAGVISLTGGTFDNNNHALTNSGQITGYGTFATGGAGLTNAGKLTFTGGQTTVNGAVTNNAFKTLAIKYDPVTFTGAVVNNGTIKLTGTAATFGGSFTNNGSYVSDPSTSHFQDVIIGPSGSLIGGVGDVFVIDSGGSLTNNSTNRAAFNLSLSRLTFAPGQETMTWSATDFGAVAAGYTNNFALGIFEFQAGAQVQITGATFNNAIYAGAFELGGGLSQLASLSSSLNIYYDPTNAANAYLNDAIHAFGDGGGSLIPIATAVPEPSTWAALAGLAALVAAALRRRRL